MKKVVSGQGRRTRSGGFQSLSQGPQGAKPRRGNGRAAWARKAAAGVPGSGIWWGGGSEVLAAWWSWRVSSIRRGLEIYDWHAALSSPRSEPVMVPLDKGA